MEIGKAYSLPSIYEEVCLKLDPPCTMREKFSLKECKNCAVYRGYVFGWIILFLKFKNDMEWFNIPTDMKMIETNIEDKK